MLPQNLWVLKCCLSIHSKTKTKKCKQPTATHNDDFLVIAVSVPTSKDGFVFLWHYTALIVKQRKEEKILITITPKSLNQQNGWVRGCSPWQGWSWWGTHRMIFDRPCSCPRSWNIDCKIIAIAKFFFECESLLWTWTFPWCLVQRPAQEDGSSCACATKWCKNRNVFEEKKLFCQTIGSYFAHICFQIKIQIIRMRILLKICKGEELFIDLVLLGTESHLKKL